MRSLLIRPRLALQAAILVVAVVGAARADDQHAASSGSVQAKSPGVIHGSRIRENAGCHPRLLALARMLTNAATSAGGLYHSILWYSTEVW